MRISVLCSNPEHPVGPYLRRWMARWTSEHEIALLHDPSDLSGGDLLCLVSCASIIGRELRARYRKTVVIHSSDLPRGRGWSPQVWQILEGRDSIPVSLLEAADSVDSGDIWKKAAVRLEGHELWDEISDALYDVWMELLDYAVREFDNVRPAPQDDREATYYRKRTPADSRIDPERTIAEQFDLLRVADPERYPAFFDLRGHRYVMRLEKVGPLADAAPASTGGPARGERKG